MTKASDVSAAIDRLKKAKPNLRSALHASAVAMALELADERDRMVGLLEMRWRWLDEHPGHPQFSEREDRVLADLTVYEQTEDALRVAADVLFGVAA